MDTPTETLVWWLRNTISRGVDNDDLQSRGQYALTLAEELLTRIPGGEAQVDAHNASIGGKVRPWDSNDTGYVLYKDGDLMLANIVEDEDG